MIVEFDTYIDASAAKFGYAVELSVANWLQTTYGDSWRVKHLWLGGTDIILTHKQTGETIRLEIKGARRSKDKKYRATAWKQNKQNHKHSDYVVMVCYPKGCAGWDCVTPFIIPSDEIGSQVCITSNPQTYGGKYAVYRHNWTMLDK